MRGSWHRYKKRAALYFPNPIHLKPSPQAEGHIYAVNSRGGGGGMDKVILVTNIFKNPRNSLGSFACKAKISLTGRRKKTKSVKID